MDSCNSSQCCLRVSCVSVQALSLREGLVTRKCHVCPSLAPRPKGLSSCLGTWQRLCLKTPLMWPSFPSSVCGLTGTHAPQPAHLAIHHRDRCASGGTQSYLCPPSLGPGTSWMLAHQQGRQRSRRRESRLTGVPRFGQWGWGAGRAMFCDGAAGVRPAML